MGRHDQCSCEPLATEVKAVNNFASRWFTTTRPIEYSLSTLATVVVFFLIGLGLTPQGALWFESSMMRHMLIQFPLLIVSGAICLQPSTQLLNVLQKYDPLGLIAFFVLSGWLLFWMLPVNLDLATIDPSMRLFKLITVPIGLGMCFRWLWLQASPVLKCVVIFELWASITRLGWLYIESPLQLCSSYLIDEQKHVGTVLLVLSGISAIIVVSYSLLGSFKVNIDSNTS